MGNLLLWLQEHIKHWTRRATPPAISGILSDLTRSRSDLIAENAFLTKFWKQSIHVVQPDTLLRWHRELFRFYWKRKSQGKPKISPETITLIRKIAVENDLWGGAERIRGELLKLGIAVSKRTIQKYMHKPEHIAHLGRSISHSVTG